MRAYISNNCLALLIITVVISIDTSIVVAQDTLLKKSGWAIKLGSPVFVPTNTDYHYLNIPGPGISDGISYDYKLKPILSFGGSIDVFHFNVFSMGKSSELLLGYGIAYKLSVGHLNYSGSYGGGMYGMSSGEGIGNYSFKQHYLQPNGSLYYKYTIKNKNYFILTGVNFSANVLVWTNTKSEFKNYPGAGYFDQKDQYSGRTRINETPFNINYELGLGFPLNNKWLLIPSIKTSILNYIRKQEQVLGNGGLLELVKQNYSREIIFGIAIMQNYKGKIK